MGLKKGYTKVTRKENSLVPSRARRMDYPREIAMAQSRVFPKVVEIGRATEKDCRKADAMATPISLVIVWVSEMVLR